MTATEISNSRIDKIINIKDYWNVSVLYNNKYYTFKIKAASNITDATLSDLVYKELLTTTIITPIVAPTIISKPGLEGLTPSVLK